MAWRYITTHDETERNAILKVAEAVGHVHGRTKDKNLAVAIVTELAKAF